MKAWRTVALAVALGAGCSAPQSQRDRSEARVQERAPETPVDAQRLALSGTSEIEYVEGWFPVEHDAERAWRWMGKRAVVRLRLAGAAAGPRSDVALTVLGWVPHEYLGGAARELRFDVGGQRLDTFEAPADRFEHTFTVPAALLDTEGRIELAIEAANAVKPPGDERELGFATSGFTWQPAVVAP
jgi:hypothetical protein